MWPDPDARFRCADAVQLRTGPHGVDVWSGMEWMAAGAGALRVLAAFEQPARATDVIAQLTPGGSSPDALLAVITTIHRLVRSGALVPVAADGRPAAFAPAVSASELDLHRALLADTARVDAFLRAVRQVVRPGDVVVDVGAGTGLLSVAAAQAGARVYAIEKAGIAGMARQVVEANGVAGSVTVVRGDARVVDVPERADVMLCELLGSDPWAEQILDVVAAARARLLKPGGRIVPERVTLLAMPVGVPGGRQHEWRTTPPLIAQWHARYGIDFSAFAAPEANADHARMVSQADALGMAMAAPIRMATLDLAAIGATAVDAEGVADAARAGDVNGVAIGFEAVLCEGHRLGSFDASHPPPQSWEVPVWGMAAPVAVAAGQALTVRYRLAAGGARPVVAISCAS
jgi:hypothetical protein